MKANKKGFTLIEILAAVTILGILSIVAIVSVNKVIQKSKQNHYITAEDNLEMAGQSYVQQNRNALPKAIGQKKKIPLKTLVDKNYIEPIKDYSDNDCDLDNSYVQVFKYSKEDYSYVAYLDCPVYDSKAELEKTAPVVVSRLENAGSKKNAKAYMSAEDQEKLLSWSYVVYKNGKEVLNSGSIMLPNYDKKVEKTLNISKYTPGEIKVVVTATNIYGQTTKATSQVVNFKDEQPPICIIKDEDKETNPKDWTKENRTITVGCDDGEGSGCTRDEFTVTFKKTTDVGNITIEDESGNKTTCKVSVNIDTTAPECTVTFSGTTGLAGWYKSSPATAKITTTDAHSGVGSYDLTTSSTPSYNNGNNKQQGDTASQIWYGYVKDNVGNVNKCNNTVKVDTTPPTCTISKSGTSGTNGWYKEKSVTLTLNPSDALSGVGQTGLSTNATPPLGSTTTGTQGDTSGVTWYGRVQDKAGNIGQTCNSGSFKVDATKPSISWDTSEGPHNNSSGITVYTSCTDSLSGVASHTRSSSVGSPTTGTKKTHDCTDNAGNTISTSRTFKVKTYGRDPDCGVERYNSCEHRECGVNKYNSCADAACGSKTCAHKNCGVKQYKSCKNSACGSVLDYWECRSGVDGNGGILYTCNPKCGNCPNGQWHPHYGNATCRTSGCGVESYNTCTTSGCGYYSCRTSGCGVESYNVCRTAGCGVELYNECWHY